MSATYHPTAELNDLLQAAAEGALSDDGAARLEQFIREDRRARAFYVDYMSVHALLQWRHGGVPTLEIPLAAPAAEEKRRPARTTYWPSLAAAAAVLLIGSLVAALALRPGENSNAGGPKPLAIVLEHDDAQWTDGTSLASDQPIAPGRQRLASGEARIALSSGVLLAMEGPVDFEIASPGRIHLHRGKIHVYSPLAARGFTVTTPRGVQIVDLGTRFGVWVADDQSVQVHLFDGRIEVNGAHPMSAPQAIEVNPQGAVSEIPVDATLFPKLYAEH